MAGGRRKLERILVPTDYSEVATRALEWAIGHGFVPGAKLYLLHVLQREMHLLGYHEGPEQEDVPEDRSRLEAWGRERLGKRAVELVALVEIGETPIKIREVAHREQVDLIIMGTRGRSRLDDLLFGRVTEQVVHHSGCPVLVVPPPVEEE